jgi:hypothetical protein
MSACNGQAALIARAKVAIVCGTDVSVSRIRSHLMAFSGTVSLRNALIDLSFAVQTTRKWN